jgi:hypothetical protein
MPREKSQRFEPGAAMWEAKMLPLCYEAPTNYKAYCGFDQPEDIVEAQQ